MLAKHSCVQQQAHSSGTCVCVRAACKVKGLFLVGVQDGLAAWPLWTLKSVSSSEAVRSSKEVCFEEKTGCEEKTDFMVRSGQAHP